MPKVQPAPSASTQEHLDIEDILEDLVILKSGWISMVLSTSSVNFDLLSETEQDATIYAYGAFLNSLTFPLQVLIRSKGDHIVKQMGRIGLNVNQLSTQELIELFYDIYNPAPTGTQRVILDTQSYTTPIVEPAVEIPSQPMQTAGPPVNQ